ncbi:hypothetical protein L1887_06766 [Cichorium endivia]|nr:hypothetical protein L1887_06766 [Cichorium endivia]
MMVLVNALLNDLDETLDDANIQMDQDHPANMYAANGAGVVLAEKGQFDIAKEPFTQLHNHQNIFDNQVTSVDCGDIGTIYLPGHENTTNLKFIPT